METNLNNIGSQQTQPNQIVANLDMGKLLLNRAENILSGANVFPKNDKTGLYEKIQNECNDLFRQSIPYFNSAIDIIDNLDEDAQSDNRTNLYNCLNSLSTVYTRLEMYEELKPIKKRIDEIIKTVDK